MIEDTIVTVASFLRKHSYDICLAWTAALFVVYGNNLVQFAKVVSKGWHYVFRVLSFVIICGFGYGLLTVFIAKLLDSQIDKISNITVIGAFTAAFILIGFLASKKNHL